MDDARTPLERARFRLTVALPLVAAALTWATWPSLREMAGKWASDPRYSHGYLVPGFALYLLWCRRGMLAGADWEPSWWGVALVAFGEALGLAGARYYYGWFELAALIPTLAGLSLLAGGRRALRWSWPALAFLVFMIPLPYRVEYALGYPLQRGATAASTYALQTLGLPAIAEGNVILLGEAKIGVVEACNGLGMLFMFLACAVATALVLRKGLAERAFLVLSAVPIAFAANVARITLTGVLHETVGGRVADAVYHDLAGWLMMPLAVTALWLEVFFLSRLIVEAGPDRPRPVGGLGPRGPLVGPGPALR